MGVVVTRVVKFIRKGAAGDPAVTYRIQLLSATAYVDADKVMRGAISWNIIKEVSGTETYINSGTGTCQCKLSSANSWSTAGNSGTTFSDNGLIDGVSFATAGSPTHLLIRFVLGGYVKCTLAVGISVNGVKGDFKSIVFKRTNTTPVSTPSGGTYASPVPSGWSDSIPSGQAMLWASECTFYGAGGSSGWSTPRQMTDTDTYDVEFSDVDSNPGTPTTNPSNWFDPDTDTSKDFTQMLWRAERECVNGTWGSWTIVRIKGEKGDKGDKGQSSFKSTVFIRTNNSSLAAPTGGSYASPVPTSTVYDTESGTYKSWSDGIPAGQAKLWAVSRIFTSDGQSPQQSTWGTPRQMTDTDTYDVEFSDVDSNPGTPTTNPSNWFDPDTDTSKDFTQMLWRAEKECVNGVWGNWTVVRIKGEKGDNAVTYQISLAGSTFYRDPNTDTIYVDIKGKVYKTVGGATAAYTALTRSQLSLYFLKTDGTTDSVPNVNNINDGYTVSGSTFASKFYNGSGYADECAFVVVLTVDGSEKARESIQITTNGEKGNPGSPGGQGPRGYRGPALRGPQEWEDLEIGFQFYKGDADTQEPYEDFVVYKGFYYKCSKSHTKTATNYPGSTYDDNNHIWEQSLKWGIVAANILFGEHGYFGSAIISGDWMISTNGTINGVAYNNGAKYNGIIAYSLFNPNRPLGGDIVKYSYSGTYSATASQTIKAFDTITLESGKVYFLEATGYSGNANGTFYVRVRNTSTGATYTPVMINGTSSVTRSGLFNCTASGSYSVEIYNTSGYTATVTAVGLYERTFAPMFALDLLTGKTYQRDGVFSGFVRKAKTIITTSNINNYKRDDITTATVLDFDKCGSFIELRAGTTGYLSLPLLCSGIANRYTSEQKDQIRSFIGTKLLIYNNSGINMTITYKMWGSNPNNNSYTLYSGNCSELECIMDQDDDESGNEMIYWRVNKTTAPV